MLIFDEECEEGESRDDRPDISSWGPSNECRRQNQ